MNVSTNQDNPPEGSDAGHVSGVLRHALAIGALFVLCALPSLYHGVARDVLANSDMDLFSVYQALLINANQPLVTFIHTGYIYFLSLAGWFQVFAWLGLVPVHDIDGLLATNFDTAYAALIVAGRWFSIFQACILVGLVYVSVCTLFGNRNKWFSFLLSAVFAIGGGGVAAHSVQLRTELLSMILIFAAAMTLMSAPKATFSRGLWLLGLAGFFIHAALMVKIQNIIVIMFLPMLPLVFSSWELRNIKETLPAMMTWGVLVTAVVLSTPVAIIYINSLVPGSYGFYQGLIVAFVIACALIYGQWNLGAARHGVVGLGAVAIGFSLAYGLSVFNNNWWTTFSVANFFEQMSLYSPPFLGKEGSRSLADGIYATDINRFVAERLQNIDYPFAVFYLLVPAAAVVLAMRGKLDAAVKVSYLCLMAGIIVLIFWVGRGFFNFYYSLYVETWVILAAAIAVKEFSQMTVSWPWLWLRIGQVGLLIVFVAVVGANVRFRLMDTAAANPIVAKSECFIRGLTPLIYEKFDGYCGTSGRVLYDLSN